MLLIALFFTPTSLLIVSSWANEPHPKESLYMHQALVGLPDQSRDEQQTKSEGPHAGPVDPSSVSQTWEAMSQEET